MGVAADAVSGPPGELDELQRAVDPLAGAVAVVRREQLEVAPAAQVRIEGRRLDEPGDAVKRVDGHRRVAAEHPHAPGGRPDQTEHHPQRGGLAGPVRAEVAIHVAGVNRQIDAGDRRQVAVALDEPPDLDRGRPAPGAHRLRAAASATDGVTEPSTV